MSLALFASPIDSKDEYLENKINKEKSKLSFQDLQDQLKPTSAHGAYNAMNGKESEYSMNDIYQIHRTVKEEGEKELSNFYETEKNLLKKLKNLCYLKYRFLISFFICMIL
jgi:hypothetical protein